ncbi:SepM family pheromone-processing serine protease [Carnobacterium pleistocenium]|uniref:SepM family pheromone-processing serine protease n=1 Tax=Carnobacterium pleistocenium TaxID=181073 RepID=UPI0005567CDF|nr:SepM family pheromone-processing serine protease [Carnobacterium pleistocenium]
MNPKGKRNHKKLFIVLIIFILTGMFLPIPYYIEGPGSAVQLNELVEVNNEKDQEEGHFMLTTVAIRRATPLTYFMKYMPFHEGLTREELFGTGTSDAEYTNLQNYYMTSSINSAIELAYDTAGKGYQLTYNGVYIMSILEGSNFDGQLAIGDTILSLDGQSFDSSVEFIDYVQQQKVGQTIEVTYERNGEKQTISNKLMEMNETKKAGLGISLVDNTSIKTDIPVAINAGEIGGPSAGFMFALQIYTQLIDKDLREGSEIAGTGTIESDGTIGRIGGIDKKVVAASEEGATFFFAPDDTIDPVIQANYPELTSNYQEALEAAEKIDTEMKIIPVKTFQDAIDYLESL